MQGDVEVEIKYQKACDCVCCRETIHLHLSAKHRHVFTQGLKEMNLKMNLLSKTNFLETEPHSFYLSYCTREHFHENFL